MHNKLQGNLYNAVKVLRKNKGLSNESIELILGKPTWNGTEWVWDKIELSQKHWVLEQVERALLTAGHFRGILSSQTPQQAVVNNPAYNNFSEGTLWYVDTTTSFMPNLATGTFWNCYVKTANGWSTTAKKTYGIKQGNSSPKVEERVFDMWVNLNEETPDNTQALYYRLGFKWNKFSFNTDIGNSVGEETINVSDGKGGWKDTLFKITDDGIRLNMRIGEHFFEITPSQLEFFKSPPNREVVVLNHTGMVLERENEMRLEANARRIRGEIDNFTYSIDGFQIYGYDPVMERYYLLSGFGLNGGGGNLHFSLNPHGVDGHNFNGSFSLTSRQAFASEMDDDDIEFIGEKSFINLGFLQRYVEKNSQGGGGGIGSVAFNSRRNFISQSQMPLGPDYVAMGNGFQDVAIVQQYRQCIPMRIRQTFTRCDWDFSLNAVGSGLGAGLHGRIWRNRSGTWVAIGTQWNIGSGSIAAGMHFAGTQTGLDLRIGDDVEIRITALNQNWGATSNPSAMIMSAVFS